MCALTRSFPSRPLQPSTNTKTAGELSQTREEFEDILILAKSCKFRDCSHRCEPECAVEAAVVSGRLERERLENYRKLDAELRFQQRKMDPWLAREVKEQWKRIHKAMRHHKPSRS